MSKFLKFLVALILIVFIGSGAALIVPQFAGDLDTIVVQEKMISNRAVGSVLYTRKENTADLQVGDKVLDLQGDTLYVHEVVSYDSVSQTAQVTGSTATTIRLSEYFTRVVATVPLIGFLTLATQSVPGLILLGLLLGLVILLFVASEVLRRTGDEEEEEDYVETPVKRDDEDEFYAGLAQRKRETESLIPAGERLGSSTAALPTDAVEQEEWAEEVSAPAGLFEEEKEELARADAEGEPEVAAEAETEATEVADGMLELTRGAETEEAAPEGKEETPLGTGELPDVQAALEAALENQQLNHERPTGHSAPMIQSAPEEEPVAVPNEDGEIELAMPVYTVNELMEKAYADGIDPVVRKNEQHGVTFVDYSDCL